MSFIYIAYNSIKLAACKCVFGNEKRVISGDTRDHVLDMVSMTSDKIMKVREHVKRMIPCTSREWYSSLSEPLQQELLVEAAVLVVVEAMSANSSILQNCGSKGQNSIK